MSETSARLVLPFIMPSQAQKHVTHNEALARLDVLVQLAVASFDAATPPAAPAESEAHVVAESATGIWAGQGGRIAAFIGGGWEFIAPRPGWIAATPAGEVRVFTDAGWSAPVVPSLGINAAPDAANRLTVAGDATLLTHDGTDHRVTVNKAGPAATASMLFQSGWSGRAEMGLAGEDAFAVKVSPDGAAWTTALRLDPATGTASGAAVQEAPADTTPGRLMRADYGYGPGNLLGAVSLSGGVPTGAVIEAGEGFTRFADGTQICTADFTATGIALTSPVAGGYAGDVPVIAFARPFASPPSVAATLAPDAPALVKGAAATATGATLALWSAVSGPVAASGHVVAIGRWG